MTYCTFSFYGENKNMTPQYYALALLNDGLSKFDFFQIGFTFRDRIHISVHLFLIFNVIIKLFHMCYIYVLWFLLEFCFNLYQIHWMFMDGFVFVFHWFVNFLINEHLKPKSIIFSLFIYMLDYELQLFIVFILL